MLCASKRLIIRTATARTAQGPPAGHGVMTARGRASVLKACAREDLTPRTAPRLSRRQSRRGVPPTKHRSDVRGAWHATTVATLSAVFAVVIAGDKVIALCGV